MPSEQELKQAAAFREEIHREALARVRAVCPGAEDVADKYPVDAYFQEVWDYPGQWYTVVGTPHGAGSRRDLVCAIVRETLTVLRDAGAAFTLDAYYKAIAELPSVGCEYRLVTKENEYAKKAGAFPCRGEPSHRMALSCAAPERDVPGEKAKKLGGKALFAPAQGDGWTNYRKAFLRPAGGKAPTDGDFERINAVLFPGGWEELEVYRWSPDREGLCLSVYDRTLERFVIVLEK